jgi:TRAP-type C4-dicarboxylate transport system permease small subunit
MDDLLNIIARYIVYLWLAYRISLSAFRSTFTPFLQKHKLDIRFILWISACCWVYYALVYTSVLVSYFFGIDTFANITNYLDYLRPVGLTLVASTGYLITRLFP